MPRKRKTTYPPPKSQKRRDPPVGSEESPERPNLARINLEAGAGRAGFAVGDKVRIDAGGLYSGQIGVIERLTIGVIPSAVVRVEGGGTRQVRTIDLVNAPTEQPQPKPPAEASSED